MVYTYIYIQASSPWKLVVGYNPACSKSWIHLATGSFGDVILSHLPWHQSHPHFSPLRPHTESSETLASPSPTHCNRAWGIGRWRPRLSWLRLFGGGAHKDQKATHAGSNIIGINDLNEFIVCIRLNICMNIWAVGQTERTTLSEWHRLWASEGRIVGPRSSIVGCTSCNQADYYRTVKCFEKTYLVVKFIHTRWGMVLNCDFFWLGILLEWLEWHSLESCSASISWGSKGAFKSARS